MWERVQTTATGYIKAYLCLQCLVMCGNTFHMIEYENFSNMESWPIHVSKV